MKANADWLMANPKVKVRIEGNCDERGTIEYNQALGQRRAQAPRNTSRTWVSRPAGFRSSATAGEAGLH